jgi:hypothetical protein
MLIFRIYFEKCSSGFQVKCAIDREAPYTTFYGILKNGRIMSKEKTLSYAKNHIVYRKSSENTPYEYMIDETNLS